MLSTKQVSEILGCCETTARKRLENAGIKITMRRSTNSRRKFFFKISEQQLRDLGIEEKKRQPSEKIAMQKADSLRMLESMFNRQLRI